MPTTTHEAIDMSIMSPATPEEDWTFEQLAASYNFRRTKRDMRVFIRLIVKECEKRTGPVSALDIGCGAGISGQMPFMAAIRNSVDTLHGLEPDEKISPPPGVYDEHQYAFMENARLDANRYDIAYCAFVMEHVERPRDFLRAVARCIKPGGTFIFYTPNGRHYFTRGAKLLQRLHLDEIALRVVRGKQVESYHYPVFYRFNDEKRIAAECARVGFDPPEFAYLESVGPKPYMSGPLRPLFHLLAWKRTIVKQPKSLLTMICRITKPDS